MEIAAEYINDVSYWNLLREDEKELLTRYAVLRKVEAGEVIFGAADSCLGLIHVVRGRLRASVVSEEGREITLFHIMQGDDCVLSASCCISQITFETSISAVEDSEILITRPDVFKLIIQKNLHARCYMYEKTLERTSSIMWVLQQILFKRFDQRLADFLIDRYDETGDAQIRLTQEEIAREVNSAREVVARMLRQFASDGLVEVKRGVVVLLDVEGLAAIALS